MNSASQTLRKSPLKNPYLYSGLLIFFVVVTVLYVMVDRYLSRRAFEERTAREQAAKRLEDDRVAIQQLGGSELSIRGLYVSPAAIHPGQPAQICYDVSNAKTISLDPPVGEVWPSHNRCIDLKLKKSTTFTLSIADSTGKSISQSVELKVQ